MNVEFIEALNDILQEAKELLEDTEDHNAIDLLCEEIKELQDEENSKKVDEVVKNAVTLLASLDEKIKEESDKMALQKVVNLLKSLPGYKNPAPNNNSHEEVKKMEEQMKELKVELDAAKAELSTHLSEIEELKDALIEKDKKVNELVDSLKEVTEAKDGAESELAKIEQEKKDIQLKEYVVKEVTLGYTKEQDSESRLGALRKLNDDSLGVYTGMLEFQLKLHEKATAERKTLSDGKGKGEAGAGESDDAEKEELKKALEEAFGLKKKE